MNKRVIAKAAVDSLMAVLFLLLMNTSITGIWLHEVSGVAIVVLFLAHLFLNRKCLANIFRRLGAGSTGRQKGTLILNTSIFLSTTTCVVTGVMISQYLFVPLAQSNSAVWYDVHDISAWVSLSLLILHGVLHWRWIAGILRQIAERAGKVKALAARAGAGLLAAGAVLSLFTSSPIDKLLPSASTATTAETAIETNTASATGAGSSQEGRIVPEATQSKVDVTLQEYLSKLYCTACHRHCPLSNPQCMRGQQQTERATQEYNETISDT